MAQALRQPGECPRPRRFARDNHRDDGHEALVMSRLSQGTDSWPPGPVERGHGNLPPAGRNAPGAWSRASHLRIPHVPPVVQPKYLALDVLSGCASCKIPVSVPHGTILRPRSREERWERERKR